jgi:hypothetical protein
MAMENIEPTKKAFQQLFLIEKKTGANSIQLLGVIRPAEIQTTWNHLIIRKYFLSRINQIYY